MKDKLVEATARRLLKESTYYEILATNRGMWGGLTQPMSTHGKYIVFTNESEAKKYLNSVVDAQGRINNFNSYRLSEISSSDVSKYCIVVDSVAELEKMETEFDKLEKDGRDTCIIIIRDFENYFNDKETGYTNDDTIKTFEVTTKNLDSRYGTPSVTLYINDIKYKSVYVSVSATYDNTYGIVIESYISVSDIVSSKKDKYYAEDIDTLKSDIDMYLDKYNEREV